MAFYKVTFRFFAKVNCIAIILCLVGCGYLKSFSDQGALCETQLAAIGGRSNVSLFLNITSLGASPNASLKISSIELLVDDLWVPFSSDVFEVNSVDKAYVQRFLGRQWLQGQFCRGIRIKVTATNLSRSKVDSSSPSVVSADSEIILQNPIELEPDSRKVLFLEWDPGKSFSDPELRGTALSAYQGLAPRISSNLIYVACPDIDTVYVVRADKFQVVDAFAVKGKPSYLAVASDKKTIYVLSESRSKIIPYDVFTHFPGNEINIPLANSPNFMVVTSSQIAYVLDARGVLTSIDLVSGNMLNRNRIGNRPNYISYISAVGKLAVSSTFDQTVYLVNRDSLVVEDSVALGSAPSGLLSWGGYLYIAEGAANSVSIYDLNARKMLKSIRVGFEPYRLVALNNSTYVTNYGDGTISIMQGGYFNVSKEVSVGKSAREMVIAEKQRLLFVGEGDCNGSLAVVDTTINQVVGRIELGAKPLGISVIE